MEIFRDLEYGIWLMKCFVWNWDGGYEIWDFLDFCGIVVYVNFIY